VGGWIENKAIDSKTAITIASLPTRSELYSIIASTLNQPIIKLALTIQAISEKQSPSA
jgi:ribosomal protein L10